MSALVDRKWHAQRTGNLNRNVIHALICLLYIMSNNIIKSGDAMASNSPDNFMITTIPDRSDNMLNSARIGCAFGDMPKILANTAKEGHKVPEVAAYCTAILKEAAKRGQQARLYTAMQPDHVVDELQRVMQSAFKGQNSYVNAEGITKEHLPPLAFDAGYVYGSWNPDKAVAPGATDAVIAQVTESCFLKGSTASIRNCAIAGARTAQKDLKPTDTSQAGLGKQSHVITPPDGRGKASDRVR